MERSLIEHIFYGKTDERRRYTQDFPILPEVWAEFGEHPRDRVELLLTPHYRTDSATLARALRERLRAERAITIDGKNAWATHHGPEDRPRILYNGSVVLAKFSFWELMRVAMPLTDWWRRVIAPISGAWTRKNLAAFAESGKVRGKRPSDPRLIRKLITIAGAIECDRQGRPVAQEDIEQEEQEPDESRIPPQLVDAFSTLLEKLTVPQEGRGLLWSISKNRHAQTAIWRSRNAVKADAAERLFHVQTAGIRWAVLDTGIDARHPAFRRRRGDSGDAGDDDAREKQAGGFLSRIVRTYDFTRLKDLLDPEVHDYDFPHSAAARNPKKLKALAEDLQISLERGRAIDWDLLEPFLRVPHDKGYQKPTNPHGTHVAGIIAANWEAAPKQTALDKPLVGMCPALELYDLRVLGEGADEFTIIGALQFVRHLNAHKDIMRIHGVNLSMSVLHDVANYACGRTPVCEECERVVNAGVVVVAAAGNRGFNKLPQPQDGATGDYRFISITDPGNADLVITVGSTHRYMPHNYGVSYFSSRGPTGDGRRKPDLVAPGERIDSCSLKDDYETMDGTSMAAPHVSGAAALLMARHRELVGQPRQIKEILAKSATDLGREPHFQGAGMLDVLRALQSV